MVNERFSKIWYRISSPFSLALFSLLFFLALSLGFSNEINAWSTSNHIPPRCHDYLSVDNPDVSIGQQASWENWQFSNVYLSYLIDIVQANGYTDLFDENLSWFIRGTRTTSSNTRLNFYFTGNGNTFQWRKITGTSSAPYRVVLVEEGTDNLTTGWSDVTLQFAGASSGNNMHEYMTLEGYFTNRYPNYPTFNVNNTQFGNTPGQGTNTTMNTAMDCLEYYHNVPYNQYWLDTEGESFDDEYTAPSPHAPGEPHPGCSVLDFGCWLTELVAEIDESFSHMITSIFKGITWLFVPDVDAIQNMALDVGLHLENKLGFVYQGLTTFITLGNAARDATFTADCYLPGPGWIDQKVYFGDFMDQQLSFDPCVLFCAADMLCEFQSTVRLMMTGFMSWFFMLGLRRTFMRIIKL